jgi:hypothetical protein
MCALPNKANYVVIVIIIIIIIIIIFSSYMQGIYTYIPETNHVPRDYTVAAILSLLFMVPISPVPALALVYFYVIIIIIIIIIIVVVVVVVVVVVEFSSKYTVHGTAHRLIQGYRDTQVPK